MSRLTLVELVSQAENEGITLAEVISRTLGAEELDLMQSELAEELSENYHIIEDFMSDVKVPSIEDLMDLDEAKELGSELSA